MLASIDLEASGVNSREPRKSEQDYTTPVQLGEQINNAAQLRLLLHHRDLESLTSYCLEWWTGLVRDGAF